MQDIAEQLTAWHSAGSSFAVATVVAVSGSAPRDPGAALAVDADGEAVGSVSGGCVEGAVYELCREALTTGEPVLHRFGYSDEDAFAVGLTCGGIIDVFVQPVRPGADDGMDAGLAYVHSGTPVALVRCISGPAHLLGATLAVTGDAHHGTLNSPLLEDASVRQARAMLDAGRTGQLTFGLDGRPCDPNSEEAAVFFVESYTPAPRMIVFGAIDFAGAVARVGKFLGYDVTVCDARPVFATERRFPEADRVVVEWPHRYLDAEAAAGRLDARTALCVLTHDAKFDIPLLERALRMPLGFVGAMGSRRTHLERLDRLREAGLTEVEINRLRSPIGLDLGARTPEETAVAVAAEIVAHRRGGGCLPLSAHDGPIHHDHRGQVEEPRRIA
ncbi:XdhC family protein [Streptacidiphilus jiangxiensis]|uniref:Xanthine dehydrogenase accessory factor n=1 Tax=Streptacidiphilus jiangxiensis TaxID=235985 RepID=A0A1H7X3H1_STRJI|nr:XdhC/CoxI family protein [Streptacidiphilus jiangxiensis]SEM28155.1 xanthine dehydrogenase accessory factor [Streptacidiphilus jiangxiensis]